MPSRARLSRFVLGGYIALVAAAAMAGPVRAADTVTFASFGGTTQEAEVKGLLGDSGKLGIQIRQERNGFWPGIKAHLVANAPGWDLTSVRLLALRAGSTGRPCPADRLFGGRQVEDPGRTGAAEISRCHTFTYGIAYQKAKYGANPPKNWVDFWDVKNFPGRRSMLAEGLYAFEAALIADGVVPADVYKVLKAPGGIDRAFAKLEQIKPSVSVWYKSAGQALQIMHDGEVDMALLANGRAAELVRGGSDIGYVWNQAFIDTNCFLLPKNAANPAAVMKLLNGALDPVNQATFASMSGYGPINPKAFDTGLLKPEIVQWLPTAPDHLPQEIFADQSWYASPGAQDAFVRFSKFLQ